jgi:hypothetical protein
MRVRRAQLLTVLSISPFLSIVTIRVVVVVVGVVLNVSTQCSG